MIRSCLVFPELGLVRVSNCPMRTKEFLKQARYRRDMQSFNWQLSETVKNVRKHYLFLHVFKQVMNKFRIYDAFIGDMILQKVITPVPRYYSLTLGESNYHLKAQLLFSRLKMLGYTDVNIPAFTDFEIEMSFVKSVRYISPELSEKMEHLYKAINKCELNKNKWKIIASYIKHESPNSTLESSDFIDFMNKYKKHELYFIHCLRHTNLSLEENTLLVAWWDRIKHSNKNE
jgi:hypothetical protein